MTLDSMRRNVREMKVRFLKLIVLKILHGFICYALKDSDTDANERSAKPSIEQLLENAEENGVVQLDSFRWLILFLILHRIAKLASCINVA